MNRRALIGASLGGAVVGGCGTALAMRVNPLSPLEEARRSAALGEVWTSFATVRVPDGVEIVYTSGYDTPGLGAARYELDADQKDAPSSRFRRRSANGRWFRIAEAVIGYTMAGARGDGTGGAGEGAAMSPAGGTDDTAAIQALYDHLAASGGGTALVEPRQFNVSTIRVSGGRIRTVGLGSASHVHTTATKGRGAVFAASGATSLRRIADVSWENLRISGGARWGKGPFDFNDVLCGYGIQTRWVDDVRVADCAVDHVSDSGVSIRDGLRPLVSGNVISDVAQGIDIFFDCIGGRVIGNVVRDVRVVAAINVEGQAPVGHPRGTIVSGNTVEGATTSGIDVIEAFDTDVSGNTVTGISGDHPGFPGYSFGIHLFGSPGTRVAGNRINGVLGKQADGVSSRATGVGIDVAANSGGSAIVGNVARRCSRAACSVNDTRGTAATYDVIIEGNTFDTDVVLQGNATVRAGASVRTTRVSA